jgi:hypothetical protein
MNTALQTYSFHVIPAGDAAPTREAISSSKAVEDYLHELLQFLLNEDTNVRNFEFESGRQPEAKAQLCALPTAANFNAAADVLAKRLHEKQQDAETGSIKVQAGDLLTMVYTVDSRTFVLLAKLEQVSFLNRATWQKDSGFPFERNRLLKTCLCEMTKTDGQWAIGEVSIYDSNSVISRFWWHDFLELVEMTDDASNSQRAYAAWRDFIEKEIRPTSKADSHILRNAVGCYFRNKQPYVHGNAVAAILSSYTPENPNLNMPSLAGKAQKLPQQAKALGKRFDANFQIDPKACNIRLSPIKLTPEIDLVLKAPVQNLKDVVKAAVGVTAP